MTVKLLSKKLSNVKPAQVLELFSVFEHKPWSFLLDSCEQTHMDGRYDILVHSPCLTYEFTRGEHSLAGDCYQAENETALHTIDGLTFGEELINSDCPYQNLAKLQGIFSSVFALDDINKVTLPFVVGALGVFAYDGNTSFDKIRDDQPQQYVLPDISVGFYHSSVIYDNQEQTLSIFSIDKSYINNILSLISANNITSKKALDFTLLAPWASNMSKAQYCEKFNKIDAYLRAGDCYQVNFAQRFSAPYQGSEWTAYCQLREVNKAPFSAFVRLPSCSVLSLSPERFLQVKDSFVEAKPIKGTRKRSKCPEEDKALAAELLNAEKDRAENLMIVDLLRNDLSKHCQANSVEVPKLFALESYPAVHHMVSTVIGKLKADASVYDLIKGAFPGGSITGAPKVRAMQIIQELEPDKRAIYCGTIGYIGIRSDVDTNICIRTLLGQTQKHQQSGKTTNQLYCWAGGGIVIDSQDEDEYFESLHKVAKILPILPVKPQTTMAATNHHEDVS